MTINAVTSIIEAWKRVRDGVPENSLDILAQRQVLGELSALIDGQKLQPLNENATVNDWKECYGLKEQIDVNTGAKLKGLMMVRKRTDGQREYRALTPYEEANYVSRETW